MGRSTNFEDFAYRRSFDYMSWATGERRGLWEVPYVGMAVLYRADAASLVGAFLNATLDNIAEDQVSGYILFVGHSGKFIN